MQILAMRKKELEELTRKEKPDTSHIKMDESVVHKVLSLPLATGGTKRHLREEELEVSDTSHIKMEESAVHKV